MKKKPRKLLKRSSTLLQPVNEADGLSAYFKQFEGKTPRQFIEELFPNGNPESVIGYLSGLGLDFGITIPSWAIAASRQMWKYFFCKALDFPNSVEDRGAMASVIEDACKELCAKEPSASPHPMETLMRNFGKAMVSEMEKEARTKSRRETAKFFLGRVRGEEAFAKVKNPEHLKMLKRAPIYFAVCLAWQKFKTFDSKADAERWLREQKVINENVTSREVSAVLTIIGFRPRGPGRPKTKKN